VSNIAELKSMVEDNIQDLSVKDRKIVDFKNEIDRLKEEKDEQLKAKDKELNKLSTELRIKDSKIQGMEGLREATDSKDTESMAQTDMRQEDIGSIEMQLEEAKIKLDTKEKENEEQTKK
jgi:chromosome segregation ATPase